MATGEQNASRHEREPDVPIPRWERILVAALPWGGVAIGIAGTVLSHVNLDPAAESLELRAGGAFLLIVGVVGCLLMARAAKRYPNSSRFVGVKLISVGVALVMPVVVCAGIFFLLMGSSPLSKQLHDWLLIPGIVLLGLSLLGIALVFLGCFALLVELIVEYRRLRRPARSV